MRSNLFLVPLFLLAATAPMNVLAGDPPSAPGGRVNATALKTAPSVRKELDPDAEASRNARKELADIDGKLKPLIKADPRTTPLIKEITEALDLKDRAARKAKLQALSPRIAAVRNDALKKAGFDPKLVETKVAPIRKLREKADDLPPPPPPPPPGSVISTTTATSFTSYSYKDQEGCPDSSDTWDFDGAEVKVRAISTPTDDDCTTIRAGKQATFQVPPGTKKIKVEMRASADLDAFAAAFGVFAETSSYMGIRLFSPSGVTLSEMTIGNSVVPLPVLTRVTKNIRAKNFFPNPLPFDISSFTDEVQEGDSAASATFVFKNDPGPALVIGAVTGGFVDADLSGVAKLTNEITPKSIKVTFYR
jgi:hypothetical protein